MKLEVQKLKGVTLIAVSGTITILETPRQLKDRVSSLVKQGERNIVLSLSQLTFVDSSCIGEIVACCITVARAGGTLKLSEPPRRVHELLQITRLAPIIECYETDAAALASFGTAGE